MASNSAAPSDTGTMGSDLGPLAWVLDELRKSLDGATKAMRRFVRDAELARGSDLTDLDASQLRIARQQLHQAVGALEMVGLSAPAKVLRSMEALAQKFVQRPELCSDDAAGKLERASFALTEFLEGLLKGKVASPVALFPQYRAVQELAGAERIHPADLWMPEWRWVEIAAPRQSESVLYSVSLRSEMDGAVLKVVKTGDAHAAMRLSQICEALAAGQATQPRIFWRICAGYFEATALGLCPKDVYNKRAASRILQQYAALARGDDNVSDRLAQDLVFFCSLAVPLSAEQAPLLQAVRRAYALEQTRPINYEAEQFGRFDPGLLALTRKRISSAAETWSALAGGDTNRLGIASEQFTSVTDSMVKLHPESGELAHALSRAIAATVTAGVAPAPSVAMEVATTVLYLEAAYEDLDPTDSQMSERGARLSQRLAHVLEGGNPEPMEAWMEELYRRVSDRQTMGSVVAELRTSLNEVEKSLDQFFRTPQDKSSLRELPSKLAQMRGVFSVLGLDQPSLAALRMRASVEQFLVDDIDEESARTGIFEKLGNSLGAMGFLIDMLSYQRELAKRLFVYDEELGEFRPLMGRERITEAEPEAPVVESPVELAVSESLPELSVPDLVSEAEPELVSVPVPQTSAPAIAQADDGDDDELLDIFLEEAREVVQNGLVAVRALAIDPADMAEQTVLRRAFHTLKGSSRMVGLNEFGEAAWSFEQLLNTSLAEQRPVSDALITVANSGMQAFGRWVEDIGAGTGVQWDALEFRKTSDGLRLNDIVVPLLAPGAAALEIAVPSIEPSMPASFSEPIRDFAATQLSDGLDLGAREPMVDFASTQMFDGFLAEAEEIRPDFASTQIFDLEATQVFDGRVARSLVEERQQAAVEQDHALGDFDFGELETPAEPLPASAEQHDDAVDTVSPIEDDIGVSEMIPELEMPLAVPEGQDELVADQLEAETDERIKVIGPLRLSIPLYNVYLNEADEWSRRLQTELSEWALELHKQIPDSVVVLAHSLLGSSATVGFTALSEMARALEQALLHVQLHQRGLPEHGQIFNSAAEDIRRLLHQFAAGFLKPSDESILLALQAISATEFPVQATDAVVELLEDQIEQNEQLEVAAEPEPEPEPEVALVVAVSAAPLKMVDALEEEMDAVDNLDDDLFSIFEEEAIELLPQLGTALRQWVARPDNLGARSEALRVLHTLKGSARLAGAMRLGEMSHRMESSIELIGSESLQTVQLEPLLARFDNLQAAFAALGQSAQGNLEAVVAPSAADKAQPGTVLSMAPPSAALAPLVPLRQSTNQSVRVRSRLLDRMVNQAGEVLISRSRMDARLMQWRASLGDLGSNLDRLRQQLRDVELQAESQMQSRLAQTKDSAQAFDPLEFDRFTRVQELTRMMAESVNDIATVQRNLQRSIEGTEDDLIAQGRQARELQRDLLRTRMVEFESLSERLYGVVRQAAKDAGKQVKLDISGGAIEMDRGVLDRMAPAFEHVLRNAVAHGIEDAARRSAAGKPTIGTIAIHVVQESNDVSVAFSDDGGGLHLGKIRAKAIANGVIGADDALSDEEAANLISMPGFSTADQVTELAGRGIGMDVVRSEVTALGGRIETATSSGKGTTFKLVLPLTTAVTQVVMLRMGEFTVGVPSNLIETVLRVPHAALEQAYDSQSFDVSGESIPFFWAGALLQVSARSSEPPSKTWPVAVVRSAGQRVALHVDEVLGNREVVVKNLGPQLALLPGLAGMSVLASGAVVLIYNPVALVAVYGVQARELTQAANTVKDAGSNSPAAHGLLPTWVKSAEQLPLVLVVDDSITVRRVTQRLLKREGYRVALAADGLQALEKLLEEKPAVVLSDIEMPRMDGFDLARNIRGDERLRDLPIIMITSRIAEKHRDHARELGVDHYLGKPYSEDELLGLVRGYCAAPVES
jgi:chemosensory pili system protein ChpA (sensor histidine kinase/response regulator)